MRRALLVVLAAASSVWCQTPIPMGAQSPMQQVGKTISPKCKDCNLAIGTPLPNGDGATKIVNSENGFYENGVKLVSGDGLNGASATGFDVTISGGVLTMTLNGTVILTVGDDQTISGDKTFTGKVDASGASSTLPAKSGTSLPATCTAGEQFFKTDATAGQNLYFCTAANTWTQMAAGGSSVTKVLREQELWFGGSDSGQTGRVGSGASQPSENSASLTYSGLTGYRVPEVSFADAAAQTIYISHWLPSNYDGGSISLSAIRGVGWDSGHVVWKVQYVCNIANGTGNWGTLSDWATITDTAYAGTPKLGTVAFGNAPTPCAAGSLLTLTISRLGADAADTLAAAAGINHLVLAYKVTLE